MKRCCLPSFGRPGRWLLAALALIAAWCAVRLVPTLAIPQKTGDIPVVSVKVVRVYPHDPQAFTQGLQYYHGYLYESTGIYGQSTLRKVAISTGQVVQKISLPSLYFGEGLTIFHDRIYQLTWMSKKRLYLRSRQPAKSR